MPLARYIDWIFTTPLMLYELCHLGGADFSTTLFIIGCDLLTLSFGLVSAFLDRRASSRRMLIWFISAGFFYILMVRGSSKYLTYLLTHAWCAATSGRTVR